MFCLEVNSARYSEIQKPIRLCKKHYSPARYMLNKSYTCGESSLNRRASRLDNSFFRYYCRRLMMDRRVYYFKHLFHVTIFLMFKIQYTHRYVRFEECSVIRRIKSNLIRLIEANDKIVIFENCLRNRIILNWHNHYIDLFQPYFSSARTFSQTFM